MKSILLIILIVSIKSNDSNVFFSRKLIRSSNSSVTNHLSFSNFKKPLIKLILLLFGILKSLNGIL